VLERAQGRSGIVAADQARGLYSLTGVVCAVGLYSVLHIAARLGASLNLGEEDPLDAILSQTLEPGYLPDQLPLFNWLLWLTQSLTGPTTLTFQLIKYGLLILTCCFVFLAARRVMKGDALWAFLSVEALALIYQISWRFHESFTHGVAGWCAVAACFWAFLRVIESRNSGDYVLLGVCAGLCALTVPIAWIFLAALIAAALLQPSIRGALFRPAAVLALGLTVVITAPYFIWLAGSPAGLTSLLPPVASTDPVDHLGRALASMQRAITEPIMCLAPLIFLYPIFFPAMVGTVWRTTALRPNRATRPDYEQLILHMTLFGVAALMIEALVFGRHDHPTHALLPLFLTSAIWLTAKARRAAGTKTQIRRFVIMAVSVAIFAFFARAANMYVLEPVCNICRWGVPYSELAAEIRNDGFEDGRIIVADEELGGNLRRFFPQSAVILVGGPSYAPPDAPSPRQTQTALIWSGGENDQRVATHLRQFEPRLTKVMFDSSRTIRIPWQNHLWKPDGYRISEWRLIVLPPTRQY